ncbi:hypothetical protein [Niallia circulans]|uniref:hypothetical protein n=1 Tax=Niallia circulans TaxID=1397 RepID=UPI00352E4E04
MLNKFTETSETENEKFIESLSAYQSLLSFLKKKMNYPTSIIPYFLYVQLKTGFRSGRSDGINMGRDRFQKWHD